MGRGVVATGLLVAVPVFGLLSGLGLAALGKSFSLGFGAAAAEPGFAILAAALLGQLAAESGAQGVLARLGRRRRVGLLTPLAGLLAGMGAAPAAALAFCARPVLWTGGRRAMLALTLTANAGHGLLLPAPPLLAAAVILGADWRLVLALGVPAAVLMALLAAWLSGGWPRLDAAETQAEEDRLALSLAGGAADEAAALTAGWAGRAALGICVTAVLVLLLLMLASVGDMPSEPLGGGADRALALAAGRPLLLLLAGLGVMLPACGGRGLGVLLRGGGDQALWRAAPLMLVVALAGGLQGVGAETRLAERAAEWLGTPGQDVLALGPGGLGFRGLGLLAPFLMAASFRLIQSGPLTAAIATAGILQPALAALGLDSAGGPALAALAVGAGSTALITVNDAVFWVGAAGAGRGAAARLTLGSGGLAVAAFGLICLASVFLL